MDLSSSYFEEDNYFIEEDDGKTQWRIIYEAIYDLCITTGNYFTA